MPRDRTSQQSAEMQHAWCPACGCPESHVIRTRKTSFLLAGLPVTRRYRRHECDHCSARFTTKEEVLGGSTGRTTDRQI